MTAQLKVRFTAVFDEAIKQWRIKDHQTGATFARFDSRFGAEQRIRELHRKESRRKDYGMRHPQPAPPPRAYKD